MSETTKNKKTITHAGACTSSNRKNRSMLRTEHKNAKKRDRLAK